MPTPTATDILKLESEPFAELPDDYQTFLESYDGYQVYEHPECQGKEWQLAALLPENRCSSPLDASFIDADIKYWQQASAWADQIEECTGRDWTRITNSRKQFKLRRLRQCLTIGEENGDFLLLDPSEDFSVWVYWHDGDDVQRLADSFTQWLEAATGTLNPPSVETTAPELMDEATQFVGTWKQQASFGDVTMTLLPDGRADERYDDGSGGNGNWRLLSAETFCLSIIETDSKSEELRFKVLRCSATQLSLLDLKYKSRSDWTRQA